MAWVEWRGRPRGPTVPRRPSGALGQRGPLGPAPLRYGPPAAQGGERAGLRGRPLIVAPVPRGVLGRGQARGATNTLAPGASGKHIACNMRLVLDTSVLVAAVRSPSGASAEILRRLLMAELIMLASVPLFAEYEALTTHQKFLHPGSLM